MNRRTAADLLQQSGEIAFLDDARAPLAHFDLDQHFGGTVGAGENFLDAGQRLGTVDAEADFHAALRQGADALPFPRADDFVGDEDVVQPRGGHGFGFADFGHGDAARAHFHLQARHGGHLVRFCVRAQPDAVAGGVIEHEPHVVPHDLAIDQQRRRIECGDFHVFLLLGVIQ